MNTINAAGYLAGALTASRLVNRFGLSAAVRWGTLACVASLVLSGLSWRLSLFSLSRRLAGFGAALAFVAGGALAATIGQARPGKPSPHRIVATSLPGPSILVSGLVAPFLL